MKLRNVKKKIGSLLLAAAMIITSFPASGTEVQAAELMSAAPNYFVTKEQLKTFNTNDSDGSKNSAKVQFGKAVREGNLQWWIAGSQKNNSVTLFAATPLVSSEFDSSYNKYDSSTQIKQYSPDWGCSYPESENIESVQVTHYGASTLRAELKEWGEISKTYFSDAEKTLMQETTIYTNDKKNSCVYSTTDKLYLAYGEPGGEYITVGENTSDNLNNGLRIDKGYWYSDDFWLRPPGNTVSALHVNTRLGTGIIATNVSYSDEIMLAFELDLTSVVFASAAESSYRLRAGYITDSSPLTLRMNGSDKKIGTVSKSVHIFTKGGKFGNAKSVKAKKTKASIKKGKKFKIKVSEIKMKKPLRRHRKLSYESSNTKVATVTKKGVIKAKAKGTCTVYVYAQNGVYKKIKVTVK